MAKTISRRSLRLHIYDLKTSTYAYREDGGTYEKETMKDILK